MSGFMWQVGRTAHIVINNCALESNCYGPSPASAPTIVLLHEGLGCSALWREFPNLLSQATGCGVFVYSRSAYGQSDAVALPRPLDYMTLEAVNVLPRVLDHIGFNRGILLGHSDGASIAALYPASVTDHRVRALILLAPHFFTEPLQLKAIADARHEFEHGDLRTRLAKYHNHVANAFYGWNDVWLNPEFTCWDISDSIEYWRVPVLAIQGDQDQYGSYRQLEAIEKRSYCPVEIELIKDCHHSPHLQKPQETLAAIAEFNQRLWQTESTGSVAEA